ncbi:DUF3800 domain-containing protein [Amphritea sp.]|uniref:DUF3800 domain-containing protein n=1 Tax=Amphritea sp. TaxID=1872502 RepID=UPI003D0CEDB4
MITESGNDPNSPYLAFGDDSEYDDVLVYAFVICKRKNLPSLEKGILLLKNEFGIPAEIPIHVRNLLSGQYRAKHGIEGFCRSRQNIFFRKIVNLVNRNKCIVRFSYALIPESGKLLPENSPTDQIQIIEDRKAILHQMASACFVPYVENGQQVFSVNDFQVYISKDKTKARISKSSPRRQAHFLSELLIPTSNPFIPGSYVRLKPIYEEASRNSFLQLADAIAYIFAHAHSKKHNHEVFRYQASRIKAFIRHALVTESNQDVMGLTLPEDNNG